MYKLVSITQTGELLDLYEEEGPEGVRKYCVEKLSAFLYHNGHDSSVIKLDEYTKWRQHMDLKKPVGKVRSPATYITMLDVCIKIDLILHVFTRNDSVDSNCK